MLHAIMLQEVITAAGKFFKEKKGWKLVYGKREGEFRGEAIAFRTAVTTHSQTTVTNHAVTTVLRMHTGERWGMLSGHMPHHATIPEVDDVLCRWGDQPALRTPKLVMGIDANEQFTEAATCPTAAHANTGRGEVILNWGVQHEPSRLDYVLLRKGHCLEAGPIAARDMASSDHEPVLAQIRAKVHKLAKQDRPGGVRHLRPPAGSNIPDHLQQAAEQPPEDRRDQIAKLCREITKPGRGDTVPFCESKALRQLRQAAHQTPPGAAQRTAWKAVQKQLRGECKQYMKQLVALAATKAWPAYREYQRHTNSNGDWIALLLDVHDWQRALLSHFASIFNKADAAAKAAAFTHMHHQLSITCKHTRWIPFTQGELLIVSSKWGKHKSTGVDGIAHEALQLLIQHPVWGPRVLAMLNEALYTGKLPALVERGLTILLPKGETQQAGGRPDRSR